MNHRHRKQDRRVERGHLHILAQLEDMLEAPMVILGFVWLALIIYDLLRGLLPFLEKVSRLVWMLSSPISC